MQISPLNENSVMVIFADKANARLTQHITQFNAEIQLHFGEYITGIIPSYTTLMVGVNHLKIELADFIRQLEQLAKNFKPDDTVVSQGKLIEIPVYYGKDVALDADEICTHTGLSFDEIIQIHSSQSYAVYAIGFSIGFAFLGKTDAKITMARKQTPRLEIPAKSVALADNQTAIYPKVSPGGWQIIGRTPIELIDFNRSELSIFNVGDQVKFQPISQQKFIAMGGEL